VGEITTVAVSSVAYALPQFETCCPGHELETEGTSMALDVNIGWGPWAETTPSSASKRKVQ
jgi:hypothetical protein